MHSHLPNLTASEKTRYSRHIILPQVGLAGQRRLKASRVLIAGAGGLGCPAALYLAAAGVGTIGIADFDNVELSNLQRQVLHSTADVGSAKCQSAKRKVEQLNPEVSVHLHEQRLSAENIEPVIADYDMVIDATDNFSTRYLINDACVLRKKPNVYGAIYRFEGQASVFSVSGGPCYRCLFPEPPAPDAVSNCAEAGVLGVLAGLIGVVQATEAIKLLLGLGSSLAGRLLLYDALEMRFATLEMKRDPLCPVCGDQPEITTVAKPNVSCLKPPSTPQQLRQMTAGQLKSRLNQGHRLLLLDVRDPDEFALCRLPGSKLVPLSELASHLHELDAQAELVVYCKSGGRSLRAAELLIANGFSQVTNLKGGILAWIKEVDQSLPSY